MTFGSDDIRLGLNPTAIGITVRSCNFILSFDSILLQRPIRTTTSYLFLQSSSSLVSTLTVRVKICCILSAENLPENRGLLVTLLSKHSSSNSSAGSIIVSRNDTMNSTPLIYRSAPISLTAMPEHWYLRTHIIPHSHRTNSPLPPHRMVICRMDMKPEKLEQFIRLLFLEFWEGSHKSIIYIQGFESRDWMGTDGWMMGVDRWPVGTDLPRIEDCVV